MAYEYEFHFGFKLEGTTPQIKFYDYSATTWYEYTIPAGTYFLKHEDHTKDIVHVIINMCADFADFAIPNGTRQVTFKQKNSGDYFQIIDTSSINRDSEKLIHLLGLQDNDGDFTTVYNRNMTENEISNVPVHSWYSSGGVLQDSLTPTGFHDYNTYITRNAKGRTSQLSSGAINRTKIILTSIPANCVRVDDIYPQQTTLYTTDLAETWTASFWTAYDPTITDNCFYWEYTDLEGNVTYGTYYILEPIAPNNCKPTMATSNKFWDLEIKTSCIPYVPQDKYVYFPTTTSAYAQSVQALSDLILTDDLSIYFRIYVKAYQSFAYAFILWDTTTSINYGGLRVYNYVWQWVQGTSAAYDIITLDTANVGEGWYDILITREGNTGSNNLIFYRNHVLTSTNTTTRATTGGAAPWLALMDSNKVTLNSFWGAVSKLYIWNKVLSDAERALVHIGRPEDVEGNVAAAFPCNEGFGNVLLNAKYAGNTLASSTADFSLIKSGNWEWRREDDF